MRSSARPLARAATVTTLAATLAACSFSGANPPLKHGKVVAKRGHGSYTTDIYRNIYRQTNCRIVTSNELTMAYTASRSVTGGSGTKPRPVAPAKPDKGSGSARKAAPRTKRVCDRTYVGRKWTGTQFHRAVWEVQIQKGKRTSWKEIPTKAKWQTIKLGDYI